LVSKQGELRAALHAGALALRKYRPGETGEMQAVLLERHAEELRDEIENEPDRNEDDA
jgi:hypothetical protein